MQRMCTYALLVSAVWTLAAQDQGSPTSLTASVDGRPVKQSTAGVERGSAAVSFYLRRQRLPATAADEAEMDATIRKSECGRLRGAIWLAAREREKKRLAIAVSDEELAAARKQAPPFDAATEAARLQKQWDIVTPALAAVFDQGRDPDAVFEEMVKPQGYSREAWIAWWVQSRSPEGRARVLQMLRPFSEEAIRQAAERDEPRIARAQAENKKLDGAVDRIIALSDPKFDAYLKNISAKMADPDPLKRNVPADQKEYLDQRREAWWKAPTAAVQVSINDPSLYHACGLDAMGVVAPESHQRPTSQQQPIRIWPAASTGGPNASTGAGAPRRFARQRRAASPTTRTTPAMKMTTSAEST